MIIILILIISSLIYLFSLIIFFILENFIKSYTWKFTKFLNTKTGKGDNVKNIKRVKKDYKKTFKLNKKMTEIYGKHMIEMHGDKKFLSHNQYSKFYALDNTMGNHFRGPLNSELGTPFTEGYYINFSKKEFILIRKFILNIENAPNPHNYKNFYIMGYYRFDFCGFDGNQMSNQVYNGFDKTRPKIESFQNMERLGGFDLNEKVFDFKEIEDFLKERKIEVEYLNMKG